MSQTPFLAIYLAPPAVNLVPTGRLMDAFVIRRAGAKIAVRALSAASLSEIFKCFRHKMYTPSKISLVAGPA